MNPLTCFFILTINIDSVIVHEVYHLCTIKREWKGASILFISWILTGLDGYFEFYTSQDAIHGPDVILPV